MAQDWQLIHNWQSFTFCTSGSSFQLCLISKCILIDVFIYFLFLSNMVLMYKSENGDVGAGRRTDTTLSDQWEKISPIGSIEENLAWVY